MELVGFLACAALGACAGLLIGGAGIGSVIVAPALICLAGLPVQTAIAAALGWLKAPIGLLTAGMRLDALLRRAARGPTERSLAAPSLIGRGTGAGASYRC